MLFLLPGSAVPIRIHNAFITLDEIEKIMNHISNQPKPQEVLLPEMKKDSINSDFSTSNEDRDELFNLEVAFNYAIESDRQQF